MTDPRFAALGRSKRSGCKAQLLFLCLMPFTDDQGRMDVGMDHLELIILPALPGLRAREVRECLDAIHEAGLGICYESDGRELLQVKDFHDWNPNLRHTEESDLPAPPGWRGDCVNSWRDDPGVRGSPAWKESRRPGDGGSAAPDSARSKRQKTAEFPRREGEIEKKDNPRAKSEGEFAESDRDGKDQTMHPVPTVPAACAAEPSPMENAVDRGSSRRRIGLTLGPDGWVETSPPEDRTDA